MRTNPQQTPSLKELKQQARRLRAEIAKKSTPISHSQSLEMIAHQKGFKDWNTLHASISNRPALEALGLGEVVDGRYMGQSFRGELVGIRTLKKGQSYYISIQADEPVDVVKFDSFSNFRRRLSCTVDQSGVSPAKTSDGQPHMVLEL